MAGLQIDISSVIVDANPLPVALSGVGNISFVCRFMINVVNDTENLKNVHIRKDISKERCNQFKKYIS